MKTVEMVRCPNCGSYAERHHLLSDQLVRTQCPACDYLMITCASTGKVIEAYAPGLSPSFVKLKESRVDMLDGRKFQLSSIKLANSKSIQSFTDKYPNHSVLSGIAKQRPSDPSA